MDKNKGCFLLNDAACKTVEELRQDIELLIKESDDLPSVFLWLENIAIQTENDKVAAAIVEVCATHSDNEILRLTCLKNIAEFGKTQWGFYRAINLLAEQFPNYPETVSFFVLMARKLCLRSDEVINSRIKYRIKTLIKVMGKYFSGVPEIHDTLSAIAFEGNKIGASKAIFALGQYFKDNPETHLILQTIAAGKNSYLAEQALKAILQNFSSHPDNFTILKTFALKKNPYATLITLAQHFGNKPEIFLILKDFAEKEKSAHALELLAKYYNNNPETFSILKNLVEKEKSSHALALLAQHFRNNPQTYTLLKTLAKSNYPINFYAVWALVNYCGDQPQTLIFLKALAIETKDFNLIVRISGHIAQYYRNHPEIIALESEVRSYYIYRGVILPADYGKVPLDEWQSQWLLTEKNAEIRRALIQGIGYEKICRDLNSIILDNYREYSLLKIDIPRERESLLLLKMICPSTGYIHVIRVPPDVMSAFEAISWVNWGVDPQEFAIES